MEAAISWQVVLALVVILGLLGVVLRPVVSYFKQEKENAVKLNTTLVTLDLTLKSLQEQLKTLIGNNDKDHEEIFDRLDDHEEVLQEHDKAISELRLNVRPFESKR
jgi:uncharacterized protein HemX